MIGVNVKNKEKWLTIMVCFIFLLLASGAGAWKADAKGGKIKSADDLKGAKMAGVTGRMPDTSAEIFFRSLTGRKVSYTGYGSIDECLTALKSGKADVIWTTDSTAKYLMAEDDRLAKLDTSDMAAIENNDEPRFSFGMAVADTKQGAELIEKVDYAIEFMKNDGILDGLVEKYIDNALAVEPFYAKDMVVNDSLHKAYYHSAKTLVIGVTGAVPPIELIDGDGRPYGFCVAFADELGQILQRGVRFVVLDNETAFTSLMSGRVDLIFAYGAGRVTTESGRNWLVSEGYLDMQKYEFIYLKED